ncbi:MAG TPA: peptide deformylase [Candidatus Paceibacterota bacterium]
MKKILQNPHPKLREKSKEVEQGELTSKEFKVLVADMKEALAGAKDGIAIAAPQIGSLKRVFVLSPKIYEYEYPKDGMLVYINPKIVRKSAKKSEFFQGCLSIKNMFGMVKRSEKVTVEAWDETGKLFTRGASGLLAEIFQHEIDHFNGKLFIDDAKNVQELKPEDESKS